MKTEHPDSREKRYVPLGLIGTGAMAEVYRCRLSGPRGFEKLVALKKLLPRWAKDPVAVADFIDEARLAALLCHENIAQAYDFGEIDGGYFLAMEYLFGKDLKAIMQRAAAEPNRMPAALALYIAAKICAAMEYAHAAKDIRQRPLNLIHRELSPDNIIVTYDGKVKIIDFGCARADFSDDRMRMGMMKGKIAYMSPEQLAGGDIDQRADIFAIGILLYEMLSGRRMYSGDPATMIAKCRKAEYARLESGEGKLPNAVCAIVDKALQGNRDLRYRSCGDMLADMEACLSWIQPRPSSHLLGRYLRRLFAGNLPEEKKAVRVAPPLPEKNEEDLLPSPAEADDWRSEPSPGESRRFRPSVWFSAGGIAAVLIFILLSSKVAEEDGAGEVAIDPPLQMVLEPPPAAGPEPPPSAAPEAARPPETPPEVTAEPPAQQPAAPPVVKRTVNPNAERVKKIEELLAQADTAWKEKQLTDPEKECAFGFYSQILALDPKNVDAWQGIARINTYYEDQAEKALNEQKIQEAERLVQRGLQVFPDNRRLVALQEALGEKRRLYIKDLAGKAEQALRRDDLTTPAEACAYTYYKKILKVDKLNDTALDGIDRIADRYAELAEDAYRNLKIANCREFVKSGLAVAPHHPKLLELQEDLDRSGPGIFFKSVEKSFRTMFE